MLLFPGTLELAMYLEKKVIEYLLERKSDLVMSRSSALSEVY